MSSEKVRLLLCILSAFCVCTASASQLHEPTQTKHNNYQDKFHSEYTKPINLLIANDSSTQNEFKTSQAKMNVPIILDAEDLNLGSFLRARKRGYEELGNNTRRTVLTQEDITSLDTNFATLPDLPCMSSLDCSQWDSGHPLLCIDGQCTCGEPFCWHYQYEEAPSGAPMNVFSCDTCGILGSWCNSSIECEEPGRCFGDNFCHCVRGMNYDQICVQFTPVFSSSTLTIVLSVIFLVLLAIFLYSSYQPRCRTDLCNRRHIQQRRQEAQAIRWAQVRRRQKSPAFTLQIMRDEPTTAQRQEQEQRQRQEQEQRQQRLEQEEQQERQEQEEQQDQQQEQRQHQPREEV